MYVALLLCVGNHAQTTTVQRYKQSSNKNRLVVINPIQRHREVFTYQQHTRLSLLAALPDSVVFCRYFKSRGLFV